MTRRYSAWLMPTVLAVALCAASVFVSAQSDLPAPSFVSMPIASVSDIFSRF
ncbi:hypothetical protein [Halopseudomonas sp.]|uniref:hypothetical protein n=1 Tax=Halopseudomonas sp. TaxID=2901191 RepID=UPI00311D3CAA